MNTVVRSTSHRRMIRRMAAAAVAGAALLAPGVTAAHAGVAVSSLTTTRAALSPYAVTSYCGIVWGSLPKAASFGDSRATVHNIRAGRHACFDRLVIDLDGTFTGYQVRYVNAVRADGSGAVVPVAGGARLEIVVNAAAHDAAGRATYRPGAGTALVDVRGWSTFRQVAWAGSFEGRTTLALGVRARLPMRVFVLPGPDGQRLVIDVAHRW